ncbi:Slp family lipoprotein [Methylothermus subterraneus]
MKLLFSLLAVLLSGCASMPPELQGVAETPSLAQVSAQPDAWKGRTVRLGGVILVVENEPDATWIQVLAKPLDRIGRPQEDADPTGRFLIRTDRFLDPAIYTRDREITVVGQITGTIERTIGKRKVELPEVHAERWHLWPKREKIQAPVYYPYWWYYPYPLYYRYWPGYWW